MKFDEYEKFNHASDDANSMLSVLSLALSNGHSTIDFDKIHRVVDLIHDRTITMTKLVKSSQENSHDG